MRNLILKGRMVVFKTFAISKIAFLALLTKIIYQVVKELQKYKNKKIFSLERFYSENKT